ncbi:carbon starvation protein CstA [Thermosipho melanesiensis]|uniref:Carbon starvation protein CstA n=2 Tax=Thermosipho melanesiensis TaxID=46541 RepID=A6LJ89_THEM4|nr:carbon starvation protein A [Thermosipho melanesiensis]ABR29990.1 carbon starvation protein CstA [Thermosipho melanesiensis BI429]APT73194.1 carbon starvation protein CstA [Thermosipho melanesiensis]OOC38589.1 carbon starvation protein CstA [Thermosipho melanesiensis]OOC40393.1 carbon starvation protein CstA [Thermosipho melanesiensis]OOC40657.1 carbon starvation protein CstA [Thermosipho melanesiensis]
MNSLILAILAFFGYWIAYNTYGKWISRKIFKLNDKNIVPSKEFEDGVDFVPTKKHILLGHHFTTIAGTGPIVGPAIGVIWGWVPAFIWVFFGSIFMGAVHDFTSLIVSARHQGKTIGELTGDLINERTAKIFLILIQFLLWIVLAVFGLIVALLFNMYPESVFPVWMEIPIAMWLSYMVYNKGKSDKLYSIIAIILMYLTIAIGVVMPIKGISVVNWMYILMIYVFLASTLPVHKLLQPRDYINSHELLIAMALLVIGIIVGHPKIVAPAFQTVADAPPLFPILFITIACGAISGFHSLAASGTTVKQLEKETDALPIGYGGMILEGVLATIVIIAVTAGLGMNGGGVEAFTSHYASWAAASGLSAKLSAVINGSANLMHSYGIPLDLARTIMAVFIVSFAGTTMDSSARIQRFALQELFSNKKKEVVVKPLKNRYVSTAIVILAALALALSAEGGRGALILWPVFGALNQLLAGLALLIGTVYLAKKGKPIWITGLPMLFMMIITLYATLINLKKFILTHNGLLIFVTIVTFVIALWIIIEGIVAIIKAGNERKEIKTVEEEI